MPTQLEKYLVELTRVPVAPFWLDVAAKATVLLLAAIAAAALLRRSSAALRHRIWCMTFAALVLLPGLSAALPEWRLAILPYRSPIAGQEQSVRLAPQAAPSGAPTQQELVTSSGPVMQVSLAEQIEYKAPHLGETTPAESSTAQPPLNLVPLNIAVFWLVGALVALSPLVAGLARTLLLRRQAKLVDSAVWTSLLDELRQRLALARRVGLYETDSALMPMTWGLLRPVVLLPRHSRQWTDRLRRFVLLHELAHVKRCDVGFQILGRLACALYWFHPLAWYGLRRLRIERELACDDCVVLAGERATDYAAELLQIARSYRPVPFAAAVAMAQRGNLEHRLCALFDRACSHLPVSARAARLLLAGVLVLVTAVAAVRLAPRASAGDDKPDDAAKKTGVASPDKPKSAAESDDVIVVRGRVLDPDGKPFAGAMIYALGRYWGPEAKRAPLGESKSKADGRFTLSYHNPKTTEAARLGRMSATKQAIAAVAGGFGPGFVSTDASPGKELTLRLVRDDVPVAGRVLDLEGRPVAGVRVSVLEVKSSKGDDLSAWLEAIKLGEVNWSAARHLEAMLPEYEAPGAAPVITDAAGRYRVTGIGRERVARLLFEGPTIAYTEVDVVTRRVEPVQMLTRAFDNKTRPVYGADLDLTASPTQPIVGTVRDAETGKPLAGVIVANNNWLPGVDGSRLVRTITDDSGRYRLAALPKMSGIEILAVPNDDQPFFMQEAAVPDSPTLDPITVNFDLHRGIWITGRITDKATGEPAAARVHYFPFLTNEHARERAPEFSATAFSVHGSSFSERYTTRRDGTYRLVGLPGRAIVGAESPSRSYRCGVGAETIAGGPDPFGHFPTYHNNLPPGVKWPNSITEINPPAGAESFTCDIALDHGESIQLTVVDADGRRLTDYQVDGDMLMQGASDARRESHFDVLNLGPEELRTVVIHHEGRNLGRVLKLRLDEQPARALTVKLEPCATVTGRLLNVDGDPIVGANLRFDVRPSEDFSRQLIGVPTDKEGRFRHTSVPLGCEYVVSAEGPTIGFQVVSEQISVKPGETKDLGDVTIGGEANRAEKTAASKKRIRGRVIAPDEKPVKGAHIWLKGPFEEQWTAVAETDARGAFQFDVASDTLRQALGKDPNLTVRLAATADGLGFAWTDIRNIDAGNDELAEVALRMVEDLPVEGRILTADGQPATGVNAGVLDIRQPNRPTLDEYISAARKDGAGFHSFVDDTWRGNVPGQADAVTDDEGRFRLTGIGAERLALLSLHGQAVHNWWIVVATRHVPDSEPERKENGALHLAAAPYDNHYYARFTHVSEPARTLRGTVVDRTTAAPVAGAQVKADFNTSVVATTGPDGRFELVGCRKEGRYQIKVASSQAGYFLREIYVPDGPGAQPLEFQVEMVKGVTVRGRVTDRETGEPVAGTVEYYPLFPNPFIGRLGAVATPCSSSPIAKDGGYELQALPGPGVIAVRNYDQKYGMPRIDLERVNALLDGVEPFIRNDEEHLGIAVGGEAVGMISPFQFKALELIKPDDGAATLSQDLVLVPGRNINGTLLGPNNEPIKGAMVAGAQAQYVSLAAYEKLDGEQFTVQAVVHDQVRTVLFYHAEQRLGAKLEIPKGHEGDLTVRLQACATVTGRLVDAGGAPARETTVVLTHHRSSFAGTRTWTGKTDGEGNFRVDGLIPELDYLATVHGRSVFSVNLKPGELHDAGLIEQVGSEGQ